MPNILWPGRWSRRCQRCGKQAVNTTGRLFSIESWTGNVCLLAGCTIYDIQETFYALSSVRPMNPRYRGVPIQWMNRSGYCAMSQQSSWTVLLFDKFQIGGWQRFQDDWPRHRLIHDVEYNASWSRRAVQIGYEAWLIGRDMDASKKSFCGNGDFSAWLWTLHRWTTSTSEWHWLMSRDMIVSKKITSWQQKFFYLTLGFS